MEYMKPLLSKEETLRYRKQILLPFIGKQGQEKIKKSKVLVIGAGGIGSVVLNYIVASGVGKVGIVDSEVIDVTNLQRQTLYSEYDLGIPKSETAKNKLHKKNKHVEIIAFNMPLNLDNVEKIIPKYDIIIDTTSNLKTKLIVDGVSELYLKPLICGSISQMTGTFGVFNYNGSPSFTEMLALNPLLYSEEKQGALGSTCGIIGSFIALEAIKIICNMENIHSGTLVTMNLLTAQTKVDCLYSSEKSKD